MLELTIKASEAFNEKTLKFIKTPEVVLHLEHSLSSLSKWESYWEIPFLSKEKKTPAQLLSYVRMMSQEDVADNTLAMLTTENITQIGDYLQAKQSATFFSDDEKAVGPQKIVTAELIYYWMTCFAIPFECDQWPLKRLMNLIKICQIKAEQQNPKNKGRPRARMLSERAALNKKRREERGSTG